MTHSTLRKITKGTEGFIIDHPRRGTTGISSIYQVRVKMVRAGRVVTKIGTVGNDNFFLDLDAAATALQHALTTETEESRERLAAIAETVAQLNAGTIPYRDARDN